MKAGRDTGLSAEVSRRMDVSGRRVSGVGALCSGQCGHVQHVNAVADVTNVTASMTLRFRGGSKHVSL